jgi:protein-ribulosamine 3-kinase
MHQDFLIWLKEIMDCPGNFVRAVPVSGGCINDAYRVEGSSMDVFLKMNSGKCAADMFQKERLGLELLGRHAGELIVPKVLFCGTEPHGKAILVMEWIDQGPPDEGFGERFGWGLAQLHRNTAALFGLDHDNYIGSLPQLNTPEADWATFYIQHRVLAQLEIGLAGGLFQPSVWKQVDALYKVIDSDFPKERPALLHGDLWSGNYLTHRSGMAALIDPAVHYGNRETEIAFTRLFGGFPADFYRSYQAQFPLHEDFEDRIDVHQLYPLLVHANLLGGGYVRQCLEILRGFA